MKIYISGPMTGLPGYNRAAFNEAQGVLEGEGHVVLNPASIALGEGAGWLDYMREALKMLADADAVALLDGWEASRGAGIECSLAKQLALRVRPLAEWAGLETLVDVPTCRRGHPRTEENTFTSAAGYRGCRLCKRAAARKSYTKQAIK